MKKLPREVYITFGGISFSMAEQKSKDIAILPIVLESRTEKRNQKERFCSGKAQ